MAYSQTDIDNLKAAIASGARRVKFGAGPDQREIEYNSLADMERALALMQNEIAGQAKGPFVTYAEHCRD
jgi:hypothetical protein